MEAKRHQLESLAEQCLGYLHQEELVLEEMIDVLSNVRTALQAGDPAVLAEAASRQDCYASQLAIIRDVRHDMRRAMAAALGIDADEATVRRLSEEVGHVASQALNDRRVRVASLVTQADRLLQNNLIVIAHGIQVLQQILTSLTGSNSVEGLYQASGQLGVPTRRAVFQTRC